MTATETSLTDRFLEDLEALSPVFSASVLALETDRPEQFRNVAERLSHIAQLVLGDTWSRRLAEGYVHFATDVLRSQVVYERCGRYPAESQDAIRSHLYDNDEFMRDYHWGMFSTLMCWSHHLDLVDFYQTRFIDAFSGKEPAHLLDLGCGSGVWSLLALDSWMRTKADLVDISPYSVAETRRSIAALRMSDRADVHLADVLSFSSAEGPADAIVSAFVAAHLERPQEYFDRVARNLLPGGKAFVTIAMNAAESDHIYEFSRESEPIQMAERSGMVLREARLSIPKAMMVGKYQPRSFGLILEKA